MASFVFWISSTSCLINMKEVLIFSSMALSFFVKIFWRDGFAMVCLAISL